MDQSVQTGNRLAIKLFGGLAIEDGARTLGPKELGGMRPKQVLEILLAARGHRVTTDRLAEMLWGPEPPPNAGASIQTFVSVLRRSLFTDRQRARELVVTEVAGYRLATELIDLDLDSFDCLVGRAGAEPPWVARRTLERAVSLAQGDVLEDEPYSDWADALRQDYRPRVVQAHLDAASVALAERDVGDALAHADAAAAIDRFSELALRTAMVALYAQGRQHDALARYRSFRTVLDEELGLTPGPDLRALEAAVLQQEDVEALLPRTSAHGRDDGNGCGVPLLGRVEELALLEGSVRSGIDRDFQLIQIEGESGVGKTRLLHELADDLAGVRIGWTTCSQLEQHLQYVPLAAALRQAQIEPRGSDARALSPILPELARAAGAHERDEVETLEALVRTLAEHSPVVLLFDDLQFADPATVAALSYLQRRSTAIHGAAVATVRSEHAPAYHAVRALQPDTIVPLCPLTPRELESAGIAGLYESTGGNPRFVADVVKNGDGSGPSRALADAVVAQCWEEGPRAYRILVAASLLEPPFEPADLEAMLGLDVNGLAERLETLCQRRILRADGIGFRFRHDLVREIMLDRLSPARVRLLQQRLEPLRLSDYKVT